MLWCFLLLSHDFHIKTFPSSRPDPAARSCIRTVTAIKWRQRYCWLMLAFIYRLHLCVLWRDGRQKNTQGHSTFGSGRMRRCFIWNESSLICSHYPFSIPSVVGHTPTLIYIYDSYMCLCFPWIFYGAGCWLRQYFNWALGSLTFWKWLWKISFLTLHKPDPTYNCPHQIAPPMKPYQPPSRLSNFF